MKPKTAIRTPALFVQELEQRDTTITEWARQNGFDVSAVYCVCQGRTKGLRGEARRIARAMGLPLPSIKPQKPARKPARGTVEVSQQGC